MGTERILRTEEGPQQALQLHATTRQARIPKPADLERVHKAPLLERVEPDSIAMAFTEEDGQVEAVDVVANYDYPWRALGKCKRCTFITRRIIGLLNRHLH